LTKQAVKAYLYKTVVTLSGTTVFVGFIPANI